jgi:hypothetical protein
LLTLSAVSTQARPHWVSPVPHEPLGAQAPLAQTWVAVQVMLQPPQWLASVARLTQTPPQFVPFGQPWVQVPLEQALPFWHTVPAAPQLLESPERAVHPLAWPWLEKTVTSVSPPGHVVAHAPFVQIWPLGQAVPQALQSRALFWNSRHRPWQEVRPAGQLVAHLPPTQTCPEGQALPQAPQLSGCVRRSAQVAPPVLLQKVRPTAQPLGGKSMVLGRPPSVVPLLETEVEVDVLVELDDVVDEVLEVVEPPVAVLDVVVEPPVVEPPVLDVPPHAAPLDISTARPENRIATGALRGMCMKEPPRQGKDAWSILPQR